MTGQAASVAETDIKQACADIAVEVAKNCGSVPQLTFPHIYLGVLQIVKEQAEEIARLRAKLASIQAQEPVAWQCRFTNGVGWDRCTQEHYAHVRENQAAWPDYEVRALIPTEPEAAR